MDLQEKTIQLLKANNIEPNQEHDQNFLIDYQAIKDIIKIAKVSEKDTVLEIGPGTGNLTQKLAEKAKHVVAVEIDERFKPILAELPTNVEVVFGDAWDLLSKKKFRGFNKLVAALPYKMCEHILHYVCPYKQAEPAVLVVPKGFAAKAKGNPVFSAFLVIEECGEIPRKAFYPVPKTDSEIIRIIPRPSYEEDKDENAFIRRMLYTFEGRKLKNNLREAVTKLYKLKHKEKLSKWKADQIVESLGLSKTISETTVQDMPRELYEELGSKIKSLDI